MICRFCKAGITYQCYDEMDCDKKGGIPMKAVATKANVVTGVTLSLKGSGAQLFGDAFKFSKTIGKAVAAKKGLTGKAATDYAASLQRALRRARVALAGV